MLKPRKVETDFKKILCGWRGMNGPIQSFLLCSSWSFTCRTYGIWFRWKFLCYKYSYILNGKKCLRINNINNDFLNVIWGVPQGPIVGPILFNCFLNDFFYVIETANAHNFAESLKVLWQLTGSKIKRLLQILESFQTKRKIIIHKK